MGSPVNASRLVILRLIHSLFTLPSYEDDHAGGDRTTRPSRWGESMNRRQITRTGSRRERIDSVLPATITVLVPSAKSAASDLVEEADLGARSVANRGRVG
jgi:hypothetical protein